MFESVLEKYHKVKGVENRVGLAFLSCRARFPLGKWVVTDFFSRSCPEISASFGNGLPNRVRRGRPGVRRGLRSQKPVGLAGIVAARKLKIEPANKLMERILKSRREAWEKSELAKMKAKGKQPADELAALPQGVEVFHVEQLKVPALDAERCIVWMRKRSVPMD